MRVDLHNHTFYCNHAEGSMQDYIEKAIDIGIDIFGFSCHAPMDFDYKYRMAKEDFRPYVDSIASLKESYKNIEIISALEVDFILHREDLLLPQILESSLDYLIGSVHFIGEWGFDNPEFIGEWERRGIYDTWDEYLDSVQAMAKTRYFNICGHIDLPKVFGASMPISLIPKMRDTLYILKEYDMVLEINAAGLRKAIKEPYPNMEILHIAKDIGLDIAFSSDAHSVSQVGVGYDICRQMAIECGFNKVALFRDRKKILVDI